MFPVHNITGEDCDYLITNAGIDEMKSTGRTVVKIFDVTGKEVEFQMNTILFYLYDDGSTEQMFVKE